MSRYNHDNFYTDAGYIMRSMYGDRNLSFQQRIINEFKTFVDSNGRKESFNDAEEAVKLFFRNRKKHGQKRH